MDAPPLPQAVTLDDLAGRLTVTVEEAGIALGIGRGAAYRAAQRGEIPTLRLGRTLRVPVPKLLELVGATPGNADPGPSTEPGSATNLALAEGQESDTHVPRRTA